MLDRVGRLKEYVQELNDAGVRKTYIYDYIYESLCETEGEPAQLRRAKAFAHILEKVEIKVLPYELITGSMLGMCPVCGDVPDKEERERIARKTIDGYLEKKKADSSYDGRISFAGGHAKSFEESFTSKKSRWTLMSRVHHDADIEYRDLQDMIDLMKEEYADEDIEAYEIGRELERAYKFDYGAEAKKAYSDLPWFLGNHLNLNYGRIAANGLDATRDDIECRLENAGDDEKREFYCSALIAVDAASAFIRRYADELARLSADEEVDEVRRGELLEMSGICARISGRPAATFREALQLTWMLHVIDSIQGGSALSLGRLDQYLYPYYANDLAEGRITGEEAKELLACVWIKVNEPKMRTVQSVTLGGVTRDGRDACNELTRLCLEVTAEVAMPYPNIGLRVNPVNPEWIYEAALDAIAAGSGQPMLLNDKVWIPNTMKLGYSREDANDYYNMGCVEIMIPGKQPSWGVLEAIAFPSLIENVMRSVETGDTVPDTFDGFMEAYFAEMDAAIEADRLEALQRKAAMKDRCYDPFASVLIDGCIESGRDLHQGGSEAPFHWSVYAYGIGTAADSLCAVKKFVYDEKRMTLQEMAAMLDSNFEGYEKERLMLEHDTPAFGNDIEEVDGIADQVLTHYSKAVMDLNDGRLGRDRYVSTLFGYFFHIYHGEIAGATPDGRKKGEPFSDSMGPGQGRDIQGPTRMLNSALRLNSEYITGGYALNFKLNPMFCREEKGRRAVIQLLETYMENGGPQIQAYTTNVEDLKDAQIHPEKHRDLIVRVGGYCEYFVNLDRVLQAEIIKRTVYGEG